MSESGYKPTLSEIQSHAETKRVEAGVRRADRNKKKSLKNKAALAAAAVLTAAAVNSSSKGTALDKPELPDDRFTPTRETIDQNRLNEEGVDVEQEIRDIQEAMRKRDQDIAAHKQLQDTEASPSEEE